MQTDILYKTAHNVRNLIQKTFRRKNFKKNSSTHKILGCTFEEFKTHIENQFIPWMSWDNYGAYNPKGKRTWNMDHIIPIDFAKTIEDVVKLNHYMNLRPLCSKENLEKRNNLVFFL